MMKYLAFGVLAIVVMVAGSVLLINSGVLHNRIEKEVRAKSGVPVELGRIQIPIQWPPTVLIHASKAPTAMASVEFKSALITVASLFSPYEIRVYLREPKVILKGALAKMERPPQAAGPGGAGGGAGKPASIRLAFKVMDGEFHAEDLTITKFNLDFEQKVWMRTPAKLQLSARVNTRFFPGEMPVSLQADNLTFNQDSVKATAVKASFAGLNAVVQGTSLLKDGRHRWITEIKAPDLSKVPAPFELPASNWQGAVEINAELTKESHDKPWAAEGRGSFKGVKADLKYKSDKAVVEGPVELEAEGKFSYVDQKVGVPALSGFVELEKARVEAMGILNKPAGVVMRVDIAADGGAETLNIKKLEAKLWQLKADVAGVVGVKAPYNSKLSLDLKPTPLKGLEQIITPLKNSLVQGELAVQGDWNGPIGDLWNSNVVAKVFRLKNFSADVNYDTGGAVKARGPIAITLEAVGELDKGKPKAFSASGNAQLSGLALVAGPLRKEAKQALAAVFNFKTDGTALQIHQMSLSGFLGQVKANGTVSDPLRPKLNLRIEMTPLDLSELRVALPDYRELMPKGSISGHVNLNGEVAFATPWQDWPLTVSGSVKANLPEYRVTAAPAEGAVSGPQAPKAGGAGTPQAQDGFLPRGHLTEKLNMQVGATIGVLTKDNLTIKGVDANGSINKGLFRGGVILREIFGGKLTLTETEVPLLEPQPKIQGRLAVEQLIVQDAMAFTKPEYKDLATGRVAGHSSFSTRLPSDPRFMEELRAKGQMTFEPITVNTVQIGALLNDMIKKVPVLKLPPAKVEPLKGLIKADFTMEAQAVTLSPLYAKDLAGSELSLQGKVAMPTMQGDLAGTFYWVNPDVKGCLLQGNADDKGRLVVPLALKGNLMQPELSMVSDTVNKLAGKALECEKVKLVEQVKKDGGKKLEQEAKKVLKGLLGN
jgi:hypothetical protein